MAITVECLMSGFRSDLRGTGIGNKKRETKHLKTLENIYVDRHPNLLPSIVSKYLGYTCSVWCASMT